MIDILISVFGENTIFALMAIFGFAMIIVGWALNDLWRDFADKRGGPVPLSEIKKALDRKDL